MSTPSSLPSETEVDEQTVKDAKEILQVRPPNQSFTSLVDWYLGVILDNKLSFNEHVDTVTKKATNLLKLCRKNPWACAISRSKKQQINLI